MGGRSDSASISVSVSSPLGEPRLAGFARFENKVIVSRPHSFAAKCTFLDTSEGGEGADRARECAGGWHTGMEGDDREDFREDLRGLPLERRTVDVVVDG